MNYGFLPLKKKKRLFLDNENPSGFILHFYQKQYGKKAASEVFSFSDYVKLYLYKLFGI